jgi:RNA polymerase sigma factor (TIGR02999 family)
VDITGLLQAANRGDSEALDRLTPLVYDELRWLAHRQLQREHGPRTLSTTALVHEAYLKLVDAPELPADNRRHFFGAAARAMRQIMIAEARRRDATKRGGGIACVTLDAEQLSIDDISVELLALDQALSRMEAVDERLARVVECRFFGGLSLEETADVTLTSVRTVKRDWRLARAWLQSELEAV